MNDRTPAWKITEPEEGTPVYPQAFTHIWQEFAGLAIEYGGYGDITAIDPYTGRRFWVGRDLTQDVRQHINPYDMMRMLIDKMEEQQFLDPPGFAG